MKTARQIGSEWRSKHSHPPWPAKHIHPRPGNTPDGRKFVKLGYITTDGDFFWVVKLYLHQGAIIDVFDRRTIKTNWPPERTHE